MTTSTFNVFTVDPRVCRVTGTAIDCSHPACRAQDNLAQKQSRSQSQGLKATLELRIGRERELKNIFGVKPTARV